MKVMIVTDNDYVYKDVYKALNAVFETPLISRTKNINQAERRVNNYSKKNDYLDLVICDDSVMDNEESKSSYISNLIYTYENELENTSLCYLGGKEDYSLEEDLSYFIDEDLSYVLSDNFVPIVNAIKDYSLDCRTCINEDCLEDTIVYNCDKYVKKNKMLNKIK